MTGIFLEVPSTSKIGLTYTIYINAEKKECWCACKGFRIWGRCKHIRFYKALIRDLLHENPGFGEEKGGT